MNKRTNSMSVSTKTLISICACLFVLAIYVTTSTHAAVTAIPLRQAQQADKLIEQTRKNIQVLKGLRESQLYQTMNFMAVSLGVQCEFCHVTNGKDPKTGFTNWVWESDEKPEKQSGRRMLQMVLSINGSNKFDFTQNSVTCFTCHRGQTTTVGLPPMPVAKSGHEPLPKEPSAPAIRPRPTVEDIFARYVQAIGGTNASSTRTLFMKGTRVASQNRNATNEVTLSLPDKLLIVATTPQAVVRQILAGDRGWILNGTNLRTLTATEAADTRLVIEPVFGVVKVTPSPGMQLAGVEKIDGRDMWVVAKSTPEKTVTYDFDVETGLLRRKRTINHTAALPIPEQIDFEDYRDVDRVKLPFTIRSSAIDTYDSWTRTFTEIKRNLAVDENAFAMPVVPPK